VAVMSVEDLEVFQLAHALVLKVYLRHLELPIDPPVSWVVHAAQVVELTARAACGSLPRRLDNRRLDGWDARLN